MREDNASYVPDHDNDEVEGITLASNNALEASSIFSLAADTININHHLNLSDVSCFSLFRISKCNEVHRLGRKLLF